jgi:hypothetical protein
MGARVDRCADRVFDHAIEYDNVDVAALSQANMCARHNRLNCAIALAYNDFICAAGRAVSANRSRLWT